ncbi:hypothetical protein V1460_02200 [Streptomyces sp. SCSIO 30461]|uniref:hypothetical protein n=1 Tax=Streptomyces sp. SCSIO 30461 TaxID=3118085 RepID=UPI0030D039CC
MSVSLSPWATDVFGEQAPAVRMFLGQALRNMQANAQAAHEQTNSRTNHTYGTSRWQNQFERVQDELKELPGATPVKPFGFPFELMLVGRGLIYPFLYSKTKADVRKARIPSESQLVKELFTFAPEPKHVQDTFDFGFGGTALAVEPRGGLAALPQGTRLILVPFACNASELLEAHWGIAALGESRRLEWATVPEPLALPQTVTSYGTRLASVPEQTAASERKHTSFAEGSEPTLTLSSRATSDRARDVPPQTEAQPVEDQTSEDDATH